MAVDPPGAPVRRRPLAPALAALALSALALHLALAAVVLGTVAQGRGIGDWPAFYAAGTLVRTGDAARLYDAATQAALQHRLFGAGFATNAYPLPAFVAVALAPLTRLSFAGSYWCWLALNLALLAGLGLAAWRYLAALPRPTRAALTLTATLSLPAASTLLLGQFDLLVLAAIGGCYALLRRGRPAAAGAVLALALVKPHLAAAAVLLLLVTGQWRAVAAFAAAAAALLLAPLLAFGPGVLGDQAALLASYPGSSTANAVHAAMMVNVRGAVVSVTGASTPWLWAPPLAAVAAVALVAAVRAWRARAATDPRSWAIALALPLLYAPHLHVQSLVLLAGAAVLYAGAASDAGQRLRIEPALAAYALASGLWLLSLAGVALLVVPVVLAFAALVRRWPERAETVAPLRRPLAA